MDRRRLVIDAMAMACPSPCHSPCPLPSWIVRLRGIQGRRLGRQTSDPALDRCKLGSLDIASVADIRLSVGGTCIL